MARPELELRSGRRARCFSGELRTDALRMVRSVALHAPCAAPIHWRARARGR